MNERALIGRAVVTAVFTIVSSSHAAGPSDACEAAKLKMAARYSACRLSAQAKAVAKGGAPDYSKCDAKFAPKWEAAELKAGAGVCPTESDAAGMQAWLAEEAGELGIWLGGGEPVGGARWYLGEIGESCDEVCARFEKVYDPATNTFAGYDGSNANCDAVLSALPALPPAECEYSPPSPDVQEQITLDGVGCHWHRYEDCPGFSTTSKFRDVGMLTTGGGTDELAARACACQ